MTTSGASLALALALLASGGLTFAVGTTPCTVADQTLCTDKERGFIAFKRERLEDLEHELQILNSRARKDSTAAQVEESRTQARLIQEMLATKLQEPGTPALVPLRREAVLSRGDNGAISQECAYVGMIGLGEKASKRQEFRVAFDTASGQTVLPDVSCRSPACSGKHIFNFTASEKATRVTANGARVLRGLGNQRVDVSYGGWEASGCIVRDAVCVLGAQPDDSGRTCAQTSIVTALTVSGQVPFLQADFDGVLGLGLKGLSANPLFSFVSRLSEQVLDAPARAVRLRQAELESGRLGTAQLTPPPNLLPRFAFYIGGSASEFALGGHNPRRLRAPLEWASVAEPEKGFWQVAIQAVRVGNLTLKACEKGACRGIVDSGHARLGVPAAAQELTRLLAAPPGPGGDCRTAAAPPLHLDLGAVVLTLGPEDYLEPLAVGPPGPASGGACPAKIAPSVAENLGPNIFILGEPLLTRYYTVFDWRRQEIGFGLAEQNDVERPSTVTGGEVTGPLGLREQPAIFLMQVSTVRSKRSSTLTVQFHLS